MGGEAAVPDNAPIITKSAGGAAVGNQASAVGTNVVQTTQRKKPRISSRHQRRKSLELFKRKTTLATVFIANFTLYTALSILSAFFPVYAQEKFHASSLVVGIVFAAHPIAEIILTPVASMLCRRLGRGAVFRLGLLIIAAGTAMFGFGKSIAVFIAARILEGVGGAFVQVAGLALIMEHTDNLIRDVAIQEMMSGIGYAVGPFIGGLLYEAVGLAVMYIGFSAVPLVILFVHMQTSWVQFPEQRTSPPEVDDIFKLRAYFTPAVAGACVSIIVTAASYGFLDLTLSAHLNRALGFGPAQVWRTALEPYSRLSVPTELAELLC